MLFRSPWCKGCFPEGTFCPPPGGPDASAAEPVAPLTPGVLAGCAAKIIMKIFWVARVARFDLLRAISFLACHITKWDIECDKRLHRLVCYLHSSRSHRMVAWVGDNPSSCSLHLYSDAAVRTVVRWSRTKAQDQAVIDDQKFEIERYTTTQTGKVVM